MMIVTRLPPLKGLAGASATVRMDTSSAPMEAAAQPVC
jgi:hypothetical protein